MSREDEKIILVLDELKKELRSRRDIRSREEGKLSQLKIALFKELGTDDIEEAKKMADELSLKIEEKRKVLQSDLEILRSHYGI